MNARLALKFGILAVMAAGLLSGCFLLQNSGTIIFDNYDPVSFSAYVDSVYVYVPEYNPPFSDGYAYYDVTWSGVGTTTVYVTVTDGLAHTASDTYTVYDGQNTIVTINFPDLP